MIVMDIAKHFNKEPIDLRKNECSSNAYLTDVTTQKSKIYLRNSHLSIKEFAKKIYKTIP